MGVLSLETAQGIVGRLRQKDLVAQVDDTASEDDVVLYPSDNEPLPINDS